MRTEIEEQPQALRATLDALLPRVGEISALARQTRQVLFIARGTSDNAAVYGSYLVQVRAGRLATLASPSVATVYRTRLDLSGVLAVGLSQSGRTEEIVETLAWAAGCGARTLAITNGAGSPLAEAADLAPVTEAGVERAVPATKTFTTQLAALAVLGIGLAGDAEGATLPAGGGPAGGGPAGGGPAGGGPVGGGPVGGGPVGGGPVGGGPGGAEPLDAGELRAVPDEIERLLAARSDLEPIISGLAGVEGAVVSGRGFASSAALELALKLKEACYLHAMGLSFADLLHGPIAVVGRRTPAIIMAADAGPTVDGAVALAGRVRRAGATAYGIGGGAALAAECAYALPGPRLPEWLAPIGLIIGGQLLTEALARRLGINPDSPRGLSKVTQSS
jgi:glutamine---fructose-6-phosphate transaminase (isomerizing)